MIGTVEVLSVPDPGMNTLTVSHDDYRTDETVTITCSEGVFRVEVLDQGLML
jgi:hypothetical protein